MAKTTLTLADNRISYSVVLSINDTVVKNVFEDFLILQDFTPTLTVLKVFFLFYRN